MHVVHAAVKLLLVELGYFLDLLGSKAQFTTHLLRLVVGQGGHVHDTAVVAHAHTGESAGESAATHRRHTASGESAAHGRLRCCGAAYQCDSASDSDK